MQKHHVLTKEEITQEIKKCGRDPIYFIKNYCKIAHPQKGMIPFNLYEYQEDSIRDFENFKFNIILKARQLGLSTAVAGYIAWMLLFRRQKTVLVVATKLETAANLVKKVKKMIKNVPDWLCIAEISIDNRNSFELNNGSWIKASSTSSDVGRSEALSLLVLDEAAFIEGMEDLWKSMFPTLSAGGQCIAISTPNGVSNWFHDTYVAAENHQNDFNSAKLNWDSHPDRDQAWFDSTTRNMTRRDIAQEFECSFAASGDTVIHPDDIEWLRSSVSEPDFQTGFDRNLWIWQEYQPGSEYIVVADVARGDGTDYSAFHVIKVGTMKQVAEYQGKVATDVYATMLYQIGNEYGKALIVVENNNIGFSVLEKLIEKSYSNLYYSIKSTHEYVDQIEAEYSNSSVPGFSTTNKTRPLIISKLEEYIRNHILHVSSKRFVEELTTFIWNNGKAQSIRSRNDDLVMSMAIACWVRDTVIGVSQKDVEYTKAMFNSIMVANTKISTAIPGQFGYNRKTDTDVNTNVRKAAEMQKQYDWLYKG